MIFRKRHLAALSDLFVQVLRLCRAAGLVQFAHVAVDETKLKANASRHKAMSYGRMKTAEPALAAEVEGWLDRARETDVAEDAAHGVDRRGDKTPDWMASRQRRLEAICAAKAALEAEAANPPDPQDESGPGASSGMRWQGRPLRGEDGGPPDRDNGTSRIQTAASCPRATGSCRATTARSRLMPRTRSSWRIGS